MTRPEMGPWASRTDASMRQAMARHKSSALLHRWRTDKVMVGGCPARIFSVFEGKLFYKALRCYSLPAGPSAMWPCLKGFVLGRAEHESRSRSVATVDSLCNQPWVFSGNRKPPTIARSAAIVPTHASPRNSGPIGKLIRIGDTRSCLGMPLVLNCSSS